MHTGAYGNMYLDFTKPATSKKGFLEELPHLKGEYGKAVCT